MRCVCRQSIAARLVGSCLALLLALPTAVQAQAPTGDPVVDALLQTNPQTPRELLEVISILIDLKSPATARPLLERLAAQPPAEAELAELANSFGSPLLLKLGMVPELQPEGAQLAAAMAEARARAARDPATIAEAISRLNDPNITVRANAALALRRAGPIAAGELINVLADANRESEARGVVAALISMAGDAIDPISAALATDDLRLRSHLITALSQIRSDDAVAWLLRPALLPTGSDTDTRLATTAVVSRWNSMPTVSEAAAQLYQLARSQYRPAPPLVPPTPALRWAWDPAAGRLVNQPSRTDVVAMDRAVRYANEALALAPMDPALQTMALATRLQVATMLQTDPSQIAALLADQTPEQIQEVALLAANSGHIRAAVAAIHALTGQSSDLLYYRAPEPGRLIDLCRHPNRQVRYAAALAVLSLKPAAPFPGSSFVTEALSDVLATSGAGRALVADMRPDEAQRLAGMLNELGYQTDVAYDARTALALALSSADYELAVIDVNLAALTSGELLSQLRRDNRTANLPIAVVSSPFEQIAQGNWDIEAELLARRLEFLDHVAERLHAGLDLRMAAAHGFERDLVSVAFNVPLGESLVERLRQPDRVGAFSMTLFDEELTQALDGSTVDASALNRTRNWLMRQLLIKATADLSRAEALEVRFPGVRAFVRPYTVAAMQTQLEWMRNAPSIGMIPRAERLAHAQQALAAIADVDPQSWQPVNLQRLENELYLAAWQPGLNEHAIRLLARLGTRGAQRTLVEVASVAAQPLEVRQAAAAAFAESVDRFGTLLITPEIITQYDRYNASEALDADTQKLLASILDTIEARAAAHPALPNVRLDVP